MKLKLILVLFLLGFFSILAGAFFKLESWPNASLFLLIGFSLNGIAVLLLIVKLLQNKTNKTLNS
ncbi:MAG: hypothetical protein K9J37_03320 [Saprospiraceae bacterium]|nr:hypothetical protein [Saprospiraceae bacterium]MCF8248913.1 hypothetical protein [Saprospiraceae bacterium]MCF8279124.1 hypothetical protein [Bacteroidales bacterium]MCF8310807.1 hypothetical protein [Saprospiraceae bacterium]MCF8439605.1 hypothetical protein [Saprospiraceae bacterium]